MGRERRLHPLRGAGADRPELATYWGKRHQTRIDVAFVDGHAKSLDFDDLHKESYWDTEQ